MQSLALKREIVVSKAACRASGVAALVLLTALGAFVRVPLGWTPVPLTLQTFFVLWGAALLGSRRAALAQAVYLGLGAAGLPVFSAAGAGTLYIFGPTGGYLFGFIAASLFLGSAVRSVKTNLVSLLALFLAADALLLLCGAAWLKLFLGISFSRAMLLGFVPFMPGDFFKAIFAAAAYLGLRRRAEEIFV
jgi:biotin transport system substrate-specific component